MKTIYYSVKNKQELIDSFKSISDLTDKTGYYDFDISLDMVGKINLTTSLYDEDGNIIEEKEPTWTDFLFNVIFVTDKYKSLFQNFVVETPKTPFRKFA